MRSRANLSKIGGEVSEVRVVRAVIKNTEQATEKKSDAVPENKIERKGRLRNAFRSRANLSKIGGEVSEVRVVRAAIERKA